MFELQSKTRSPARLISVHVVGGREHGVPVEAPAA